MCSTTGASSTPVRRQTCTMTRRWSRPIWEQARRPSRRHSSSHHRGAVGMTLLTVPIVDIAPYLRGPEAHKGAVAQHIGEACRDIGFLLIAGHGVPQDLIAAVDDVSRAFF